MRNPTHTVIGLDNTRSRSTTIRSLRAVAEGRDLLMSPHDRRDCRQIIPEYPACSTSSDMSQALRRLEDWPHGTDATRVVTIFAGPGNHAAQELLARVLLEPIP
ncbi:MAG: hypothetical protein ACOCXA_00965 [Planctomycetota bacterium]